MHCLGYSTNPDPLTVFEVQIVRLFYLGGQRRSISVCTVLFVCDSLAIRSCMLCSLHILIHELLMEMTLYIIKDQGKETGDKLIINRCFLVLINYTKGWIITFSSWALHFVRRIKDVRVVDRELSHSFLLLRTPSNLWSTIPVD